MRRVVLIVPGLLGSPEQESVLRQRLPSLSALTEVGELFQLAPMPEIETPEALFLGMRQDEAQMRQGPLTISALKADPPPRSTHFHVSLLSFEDGLLTMRPFAGADEQKLIEAAQRLNTKTLTFVAGRGADHGLVWEDLGDFVTHDPAGFSAQELKPKLPEGEAETMLRRYIDDSINLLSELEFNRRLQDEGEPMLNVLWPWGHGVRLPVPNLALRRGEPAFVISGSQRLAGLARLVGYRHSELASVGSGVRTPFRWLSERLLSANGVVAVLDGAALLRSKEMWEELEWFARSLDAELLKPLLEATLREPSRLTLLSPSSGPGLGLTLGAARAANSIPFDERALEEKSLPTRNLSSMVEYGLTTPA